MNDKEKQHLALARAVATRGVDEKAVAAVASQLNFGAAKIRGIDPCIFGICFDFVVDRGELTDLLDNAIAGGRLGDIRLFPWGIIDPDIFHVQIERDFNEIPQGMR